MESFHTQFRNELLNQEIFTSLRDAQVLIEAWYRHCHTARPHSALRNRPPAPETMLSPSRPCANLHPGPIDRGRSLTQFNRLFHLYSTRLHSRATFVCHWNAPSPILSSFPILPSGHPLPEIPIQ